MNRSRNRSASRLSSSIARWASTRFCAVRSRTKPTTSSSLSSSRETPTRIGTDEPSLRRHSRSYTEVGPRRSSDRERLDRRDHPEVERAGGQVVTAGADQAEERVVGVLDAAGQPPADDADEIGVDQAFELLLPHPLQRRLGLEVRSIEEERNHKCEREGRGGVRREVPAGRRFGIDAEQTDGETGLAEHEQQRGERRAQGCQRPFLGTEQQQRDRGQAEEGQDPARRLREQERPGEDAQVRR